jgi:hypothetical protein
MLNAQAWQCAQLPTDQPVCAQPAQRVADHNRDTCRPHPVQAPPVALRRRLQR